MNLNGVCGTMNCTFRTDISEAREAIISNLLFTVLLTIVNNFFTSRASKLRRQLSMILFFSIDCRGIMSGIFGLDWVVF